MKKIGLLLEGGGSRGAFTSGVLDFFMDCDLEFSDVIGVSAGALNGVNLVSKQRGRSRATSVDIVSKAELISLKNLFTHHSIFDLEYLFNSIPNEVLPFDYEAYGNSKTNCIITVTNCTTGEAEYLEERKDGKRLMQLLRASTALPFLTPIATIDDKPYLDGGIASSLPMKELMKRECDKYIVVLTKPFGYRKEKSTLNKNLSILFYKKYPKLVKSMVYRYKKYNKQLEYIEQLENMGKLYVIRPEKNYEVSRTEKEYEPLMRLYQHGYDTTYETFEKIKEYING